MSEQIVTRSSVSLMLDGGNGMKFNSPLTETELVKELLEAGGSSRLGFAKVPSTPKDGVSSENIHVFRQKIVGMVVVDIPVPSKLVTPVTDIITRE